MSRRDRLFWEEKAKELGWKIDNNGRVIKRAVKRKPRRKATPR